MFSQIIDVLILNTERLKMSKTKLRLALIVTGRCHVMRLLAKIQVKQERRLRQLQNEGYIVVYAHEYCYMPRSSKDAAVRLLQK